MIEKLRKLCDGIFPEIPGEKANFKNTDPITLWGKALDINYLKMSLKALAPKTVSSICATRQRASSSRAISAQGGIQTITATTPPTTSTTPTTTTDVETQLINNMRDLVQREMASRPQ